MIIPQTRAELFLYIDQIDPVEYAKTRNHLTGAVTKLSPYITRGVITLPEVRDRLLVSHSAVDCAKLIQELAWREYFQEVWWAKGEAIFSDLRFSRGDWQHNQLVSALVAANTGVQVLDEAIGDLYTTGYMHNHTRMWVASVGCNLARAHWHELGRWLYYHLLDGDPASNFCSWQWVAGTSISKQYTVNQKLINGCSDFKQVRSILTFDREMMSSQSVPQELKAHEPFTYKTEYPDTTLIESVADQSVTLYTPWTLRMHTHTEASRHILIIDPVWFDRLPVSPLVMDFILAQGRSVIDGLELFVGSAANIDGIGAATSVHAQAHPTNLEWENFATLVQPEKIFPHVTGYYPSFFKFWEACTKSTAR